MKDDDKKDWTFVVDLNSKEKEENTKTMEIVHDGKKVQSVSHNKAPYRKHHRYDDIDHTADLTLNYEALPEKKLRKHYCDDVIEEDRFDEPKISLLNRVVGWFFEQLLWIAIVGAVIFLVFFFKFKFNFLS